MHIVISLHLCGFPPGTPVSSHIPESTFPPVVSTWMSVFVFVAALYFSFALVGCAPAAPVTLVKGKQLR